jgi:hypothetical protein
MKWLIINFGEFIINKINSVMIFILRGKKRKLKKTSKILIINGFIVPL